MVEASRSLPERSPDKHCEPYICYILLYICRETLLYKYFSTRVGIFGMISPSNLQRSGLRAFASSKSIVSGQKARQTILRGCDKLADTVGTTLGPRGRNVIIEQTYGPPKITKDGVTVARAIELSDKLEVIFKSYFCASLHYLCDALNE